MKGNNLYELYKVEGMQIIPFPVLNQIFYEIYDMSFTEWQKREDLEYPDEQIKRILSERYTNWSP